MIQPQRCHSGINYEILGWEGLHQVALTSRKLRLHLWYSLICVKPNEQDLAETVNKFLNNFYLPVFI